MSESRARIDTAMQASSRKIDAANDKEIYAFLPAAIEVEQTPSSRAGRMIIWAIMLLFIIAVIWALVGRLDIVAVAQGKIIPSDYSKQIQPLEAGKIKTIHIREGQKVKAGDLLITLESGEVRADLARLNGEITEFSATRERLKLLDTWSAQLENKPLNPQDFNLSAITIPAEWPFEQQQLLRQEANELQSRLIALQHETKKLQAEHAMAAAEIQKKTRVIPVLKERVDALETLHQKSYGSKLQFLEIQQELIEEQQDLKVQQARADQLGASIAAITNQGRTLIAERRKQALNQSQETQRQLHAVAQEHVKAEQRFKRTQLRAPLDGRVQQLAVHTIGGVVTPAQPLMVIVPEQAELQVEAKILNKDIGFVEEGQHAEVKVDTFNFTRYGLIDAEILTISDDAMQDENLGLVYSSRLALKQDQLRVGERMVKLSPGMSVTAEVKTGTRRLIEFFLSPLLRYQQESLGER